MNILVEQKKVSLWSNILMLLTSIHHVYGAMHYNTPERYQVLYISIPVILMTLLFDKAFRANHSLLKQYQSVIYWCIILVPSLLLIGVIEGVYNHILKNILYFSNTPEHIMKKLFQSEMFEMPNDVFFELTGIAQGIVLVPLIVWFVRFSKGLFAKN